MYAEITGAGKFNLMELDRADAIRIKDSLHKAILQSELTAEEREQLHAIMMKIEKELCSKHKVNNEQYR